MLERVENLTDGILKERTKKFGNTGGNWYCDNCKHYMTSFLKNFEYHIPEICPKCEKGHMVENESEREFVKAAGLVKGKQGEDQWLAKQDPLTQTSILLGDDPKY